MSDDGFVRHAELEEVKKDMHEMDKRLAILEKDFQNFNNAFTAIMTKLEMLPDKLVQQLSEVIRREIDQHKTTCRLETMEDSRDSDRDDRGFLKWVIKHQVQILWLTVLVLAAYFGVKIP